MLPFEDNPPFFTLKSWVALWKQAIATGDKKTDLAVLVTGRSLPVDPILLPALENRFDLLPIRRFLQSVTVFTAPTLLRRQPNGTVEAERFPSQ